MGVDPTEIDVPTPDVSAVPVAASLPVEPLPVRVTPAVDTTLAAVASRLAVSNQMPKTSRAPVGSTGLLIETGVWYCTAPPSEHGGLGYIDPSRLFEFPVDSGCPICPICQKQQACWVATDLKTFPEGVLRLL